ncbi:MAG: hypothetical protein JSW71_00165 [Gemmatimonadota bacterium]|nr:MAG: hypothetical protein JSW71_00165 [Gemmatimonadota bacterium]
MLEILRSRCTSVLAAALVTVCLAAGSVQGQRIALIPDIGVYIPTQELINVVDGGTLQQQISLSVGGKLDIWFGNRVGIQATGSYAPSQLSLTVSEFGVSPVQEDANIFMGSGRLMVYLIPPTSPVSFLINGGVGLVNRSGEAYADLDDQTDVGGTVGATIGFHLGRLIQLRLSGESYIYNPSFYDQTEFQGSTQNDINLSFGFGIPLLGLGSG